MFPFNFVPGLSIDLCLPSSWFCLGLVSPVLCHVPVSVNSIMTTSLAVIEPTDTSSQFNMTDGQ